MYQLSIYHRYVTLHKKQAFQWKLYNHLQAPRHAPYMSHTLNLSNVKNVKPYNDESKDTNNYSAFDAFADKVDSNWDNLIAYD